MATIHIAEEHSAWVQFGASFILDTARQAMNERGRFVMALSGGGTPHPIYQALPELWAQHELEWQRVHIVWSDERCVPLDHPQSNYRMAREALLDRINIPNDHIHPMRCSQDPTASAVEYEGVLRELYPRQDWPTIDLMLLGMGADGHTASLFPDSPALEGRSRWVVANKAPARETPRLTLTIPAINAAGRIAFLVAGSEKADVVYKILTDREETPRLPAEEIKPSAGELHWLLDAEAAVRIMHL